MLTVVFLGVVLACVAMFAVLAFMFLSVAFEEPESSVARKALNQPGVSPGNQSSQKLQPEIEMTPTSSRATSGSQGESPREPALAGADVSFNWKMLFSRDTRHLRILVLLISVGCATGLFARSQMVPADYGEAGPYRASALEEIAALPSRLHSDATCLKCHESVAEERVDSPHIAVNCSHCHGLGHQHIIDAELAAKTPDHPIPPAVEWDGDFRTKIDLFITENRFTCLSCHESVVGMPASFRSINVAEHLEEQGADEVKSASVCFECHTGHSPGL
jgi:hypothetical protein